VRLALDIENSRIKGFDKQLLKYDDSILLPENIKKLGLSLITYLLPQKHLRFTHKQALQ
jgi:hypothetical protein